MAETGVTCLIAEAWESVWPSVVPLWILLAFQPLGFPVALRENLRRAERIPRAHPGSWVEWPWKWVSKHHTGSKWCSRDVFKDGIWSQFDVFFLSRSPGCPLKAGLSGSFHTNHPPSLGISGCVPVAGGRVFLRGRHTAVIKGLVEEGSSPDGAALWLQAFARRHLSWPGSHSVKVWQMQASPSFASLYVTE